jgi:uncharacterized Zn-binding protein involved in type VI secretion
VTNQDSVNFGFPGGQTYSDPNVYDTCMGGSEGPNATGEGPCDPSTDICQNATTQGPTGPVACPNDNAQSGARCEYADGFCFAKGTRTVTINGTPATESARQNQCFADRYQNGDLDFDGLSYLPDWPNGDTKTFPSTFKYAGPFTVGGNTYPQIQFESDIGGSENLCNTQTGAGCTVPPIGSKFYPFWSLQETSGLPDAHGLYCSWNFGNEQPTTILNFGFPGGQTYSDPNVYDTCMGGSEGPAATGEGPCDPNTDICQNATTQGPTGPVACPNDNAQSGALCEYADGFCFAKGTRTVTIDGTPATESARANECFADRYQNGDLDFDGLSYLPDWPTTGPGSSNYPTSFKYAGPFTVGGDTYPQIQFESDIGGSSNLCNPQTGAGCTVPPISAKFYPYWSISESSGMPDSNGLSCFWNFGNSPPHTILNFGGDAEYGTPDVARYGGTIISPPLPNPEVTAPC